MKNTNLRRDILMRTAALLLLWHVLFGNAIAQTPFYQDKNITVVGATDPGGTADMRIRILRAYLFDRLPIRRGRTLTSDLEGQERARESPE
jgi:hypothetical protein